MYKKKLLRTLGSRRDEAVGMVDIT